MYCPFCKSDPRHITTDHVWTVEELPNTGHEC